MKRKIRKKGIVLFSGGLDSRLAVKIMQKQGFDIIAVFFKLPFEKCFEKDIESFADENKCKLKVFDCTKGKLLQEYLKVIRDTKYGRGKGVNPCIDCKIFMLKKSKKFADKKKINLIVTGEVLEERPMSQRKKAMKIIEEESGLVGRILRPLSAKLLPRIKAEEKGLVDREKLYEIKGRQRKKQIELIQKFNIKYPSPAGGCLLCEKSLKKRLKFLLNRRLNSEEVKFVNIGRHFIIGGFWIVIGRNEEENKIIESVKEKTGKVLIPNFPAASAVIFSVNREEKLPAHSRSQIDIKNNKKEIHKRPENNKQDNLIKKIVKLIKAYSKKGSLEERKKFEKYKL